MEKYQHPGQGWRRCYASGGVGANAQGIAPGSQDAYNSTEAGIVAASNPSSSKNEAQGEMNREGERHGADLTVAEVKARIPGHEDALDAALANCAAVGYDDIVFCDHRLNRLRDPSAAPGTPDPYGIVVLVGKLPARDRNQKDSARRSVRREEVLSTFLGATQVSLLVMEQESVEDGFCVALQMPNHNSRTVQKNQENCRGAGGSGSGEISDDALGSRP